MPLYSSYLSTSCLDLHLLDLSDLEAIEHVIRTFNDPFIGRSGHSKVTIKTVEEVRATCRKHGAPAEKCTKLAGTAPPESIFHLEYLKSTGEYIGMVGIAFHAEVPFPDLGYAFFESFNGHGCASDAGERVLRFWKDDIGVEGILVTTFDDNIKSQNCARRIGFVDGEKLIVDGGNGKITNGTIFVLPHMKLPEGELRVYPTIGHDATDDVE